MGDRVKPRQPTHHKSHVNNIQTRGLLWRLSPALLLDVLHDQHLVQLRPGGVDSADELWQQS